MDKGMRDYMSKELDRLVQFTEGCRDDMHEPDEQDISAVVLGNHLDNAFGSNPPATGEYGEYLIVLRRGYDEDQVIENFNLATLIALARLAGDALDRRPNPAKEPKVMQRILSRPRGHKWLTTEFYLRMQILQRSAAVLDLAFQSVLSMMAPNRGDENQLPIDYHDSELRHRHRIFDESVLMPLNAELAKMQDSAEEEDAS